MERGPFVDRVQKRTCLQNLATMSRKEAKEESRVSMYIIYKFINHSVTSVENLYLLTLC